MSKATAAANSALQAPTTIPQTAALPKAPPTGKKAIYLSNGDLVTKYAIAGFTAGVKSLGWKTSVIDYDSADPATLNTALTSALAEHPYVVAETGSDQSLISPSVTAAYSAAGVPIVLGATDPCTVTKVFTGCTAGSPFEASAGAIEANWFVSDSNGTGKALVESLSGFPILGGFTDEFASTVKSECAACAVKTIKVTFSDLTSNRIPSVMVSAARANPGYKYIIFDEGSFSDGINSALNAAHLTGYKIGGNQPDSTGVAALKSGTQSAWVGASAFYIGYTVADAAARWSVNAPGTENDANGPHQLLTSANIGNIQYWNTPADALQQFQKLWKVPVTSCALDCNGTP